MTRLPRIVHGKGDAGKPPVVLLPALCCKSRFAGPVLRHGFSARSRRCVRKRMRAAWS